jgi:hypothetical protein
MIEEPTKPFWKTRVECRVCPISAEGVNHDKIHRKFAEKFPEAHNAYVQACKAKVLIPGSIFPWIIVDEKTAAMTTVIYATVKDDWKRKLRIEDVNEAFESVLRYMKMCMIKNVAIPAFCHGFAGLDWDEVTRPAIERIFRDDPDVTAYFFSKPKPFKYGTYCGNRPGYWFFRCHSKHWYRRTLGGERQE